MKPSHLFAAAAIIAFALGVLPSRAEEKPSAPIFTATIENYDAFSEMVGTVAKAGDPGGKENPLSEFEDLFKGHPGAVDRTRTAHAAVWLNGMFQPLVAIYVPTGKFGALKKLVDDLPENDDVTLEKMDGYGLFLSGAENSLEANLAAARSFDLSDQKADHPVELSVQFDAPTRTMLKGVLAMGRLQLKQGGAELGDEATAEMMKAVFDLYFDMFDGFVDGMEESTLSFDLADDGIRLGISSSAKEDSTFGKLISKSPMAPGPITESYRTDAPFSMSGRIAEIDDTIADIIGEMAALGTTIGGGVSPEIVKKSTAMMKDMVPMYYAFGYDFDGELEAGGVYHFPGDKDVPALYRQIVDIGIETGKQMSGDGKMYRKFKHERLTRDGTEIDHFFYRMGDEFPPNPIMGDSMEMEYAQSKNRIYFAMGGKGVLPLMEAKEPTPLPEFLQPDESTVMIGHLDILSLIGTFAQVEVSHPVRPLTFIADEGSKAVEKNPPAAEGEGKADTGSKILMRANLDGALHFDLHIPLSLIRTLSRIK